MSLPAVGAASREAAAAAAEDDKNDDEDLTSRRQSLADFRSLSVSESTRRVLSNMDETQVNDAREALKEVKATRRRCHSAQCG